MPGLGTAINVATILSGTAAGLLVGGRIPERARTTVLQGVGLVTLALGIGQAIRTENVVFPLIAIVAGGLVGELLRIEDRLESLGERIRRRVQGNQTAPDQDGEAVGDEPPNRFVEGFVDASLLFCVGPVAILGSIADGLDGDIGLLVVKSALDGIVSVAFAAALGWGVAFSVLPLVAYQGLLTLLAGSADGVLSDRMILELTATGGIMVLGIGLRLLDIKAVRVGSFLPALVVAPVLVALFGR